MSTKLLKKTPIVLLALNFIACSFLIPAPAPAAADIEKEEQAVYSFFVSGSTGTVLILQESSSGISDQSPQEIKGYIKSNFKDVSDETVKSYLSRNTQPGMLSPDMQLGTEYTLLTADDLYKITSQPNWGDLLSEQYPGAHGYTILSRVGFNNSLDQAVIYVGSVAGPLMGSGFYYLMEKKNGEWLIKEQVMSWIS